MRVLLARAVEMEYLRNLRIEGVVGREILAHVTATATVKYTTIVAIWCGCVKCGNYLYRCALWLLAPLPFLSNLRCLRKGP